MLIRTDSGGGTQGFLAGLASPGRRLAYSVGFTITDDIQDAILKLPARAWTPAYDSDREVRPGAWAAELTGLLALANWPEGMRVIVRKERPHPGAQLRFTDIDGHRFTCFATSTRGGQLPDLELRHRRRARCEDRIRRAKDTGLRNLPLQGYAQNQVWCEIVALACDLLAWTQMLAFTGPARRREPKRLRLRIFTCAGRIVRGSRRLRLRIAQNWPWAPEITKLPTAGQAMLRRRSGSCGCQGRKSARLVMMSGPVCFTNCTPVWNRSPSTSLRLQLKVSMRSRGRYRQWGSHGRSGALQKPLASGFCVIWRQIPIRSSTFSPGSTQATSRGQRTDRSTCLSATCTLRESPSTRSPLLGKPGVVASRSMLRSWKLALPHSLWQMPVKSTVMAL